MECESGGYLQEQNPEWEREVGFCAQGEGQEPCGSLLSTQRWWRIYADMQGVDKFSGGWMWTFCFHHAYILSKIRNKIIS